MLKKIDRYIIRKFLGTFFFSLGLIIVIVIIFDITERLDDFIEKKAPIREIIFSYYVNFIPYFVNLFSALFVFISVIIFTANMAAKTEIVAILSGGVSFYRMLLPYMLSAVILTALSFYLNNFVIPKANKKRLAFEEMYVKNPYRNVAQDIHRQIAPGEFIYFENFNNLSNVGFKFSLEKFQEGKLTYKLISDFIRWDTTTGRWNIHNYQVREFIGETEKLTTGSIKDTAFNFLPEDFGRRKESVEMFDYYELNAAIEDELFKGSEKVVYYQFEKYKRLVFPFATIILTLIGVSIASRRVRGGIGIHIMFGFLISFSFIVFMEFSRTFAVNGGAPPLLAIWIPNILFGILAIFLLLRAPK
ncbi:MAG: LptF/LptG family permease [Vicingaceae bacterium]